MRYILQPLIRRCLPGVLLSVCAALASAQQPHNVLFIIVDDLRPTLGVYGDTQAHTPNIDALAAAGVRFNSAFANVPVCGASRASLLSGFRPTPSRFVSFDARLDRDLPHALSLPAHFRKRGYETRAYGKVFDVTADSAEAWSQPVWNPSSTWHSPVSGGGRHNHLQKAYLTPLAGELGPPFERLVVDDMAYPDGAVAAQVVADLTRLSRQPFFAAVGFRKPHLPFTAPARYWGMIDPDQLRLAQTYDWVEGLPPASLHFSPELRRQYEAVPDDHPLPVAYARTLIHGYHAAVAYVDAQIGRILDALEALELDEQTIVVLVGDHGWNLGEHTLWTKHSLYDITLRVPLIIRVPQASAKTVEAVVDLLDVYPTLVDLTRGEPVGGLDGSSLASLFDSNADAQSADAFARGSGYSLSRWLDGDSIRTARYRYTLWRDSAGDVHDHMLFDLQRDPAEQHNIVSEPQYEKTVTRLRAELLSAAPQAPGREVVEAAKTFRTIR